MDLNLVQVEPKFRFVYGSLDMHFGVTGQTDHIHDLGLKTDSCL